MMALAGEGVFAVRCPDHPITKKLRKVASSLVA
jgi:tRNA A37 threonylcarbamoyladenosine synthetase subunit TsaC/SUA5/YrdC